jgi:hypothetical protein
MKELDDLAKTLVLAVVLIIALPLRMLNWVRKVVARGLKKRHSEALPPLTPKSSKKSPKKVAKTDGSSLNKFKLYYEDLPIRWGKKRGRKLLD